MELERECSALESAEDSEAISNINAEKLNTNSAEQQVSNNGCRVAEQKQMNGKGIEAVEEAGNMPPVLDVKSTPIPSSTKGKGLRKWRRIKREARMDGDTNIDTSKMLKRGLSHSGNHLAKPGHFSAGVMQKSEGSNSSTVAFMRSPGQLFDSFGGIGDTGAVNGPAFMAGTDSENSEGLSSRSSTAASAPKMRYTKPVVVEHGRDKNWVNLSGNSSVNSVQLGQKGKNKMESSKKPRGERDKIEIENSHSSMESDSRSSNFVFMRGTDFVTGNGTKEGRSMNYDGENSDEAEDSDRKESGYFQASYSRESNGGFGDFLQEGLAAELSWEAKNGKSENHATSSDFDPLAESIFKLQTAQEALEKEVENFKELGIDDVLVDDPLGDGSREFSSDDLNDHGPSTSDQWQSGDSVHFSFDSQRSEVISLKQIVKLSESKLVEARTMLKLKEAKISELEAIISNSSRNEGTGIKFQSTGDIETELESLFKQKLEGEVEFLVITEAVRNQKTTAQISLLEEQKALAKIQAEMANKNACALKKAAIPNCEDERSQNCSENIVTADETVKLSKEVFKYTWCFFLQLVLLLLVVGLFVLQLSPHQAEVIPT